MSKREHGDGPRTYVYVIIERPIELQVTENLVFVLKKIIN